MQGPRAATGIVEALRAIGREPGIDVVDPDARRRQLRRPAAFQRRERRPRGRRVPGPGRLGGRARAGHAALRPRCRRARVDADGCRQLVVPDLEALRVELDPRRQLAGAERRRLIVREQEGLDAHAVGARARRAQDARPRHGAALAPPRPAAPRSCAPRRATALDARARGRPAGSALAARDARAGATRSCARGDSVLRDTAALALGARVDVELAEGAFGARVEDVRQ